MKRQTFIIYCLWALMSVLSLAACSDDPVVQNEEPNPPTPEEPVDPEPEEPIEQVMPRLSINGRYLCDATGKPVNLHGYGMTFSPFFNQNAWNNYDVAGCLSWNKRQIDGMEKAGWRMDFIRMHMDPYWSDDPDQESVRYEGHERFSAERFRKYLDEVFIPMAEYANAKGLYVVMRPPGVCPEKIAVGDDYNTFLIEVWDIVSSHPKLKGNWGVMFELANEPINIVGTDGSTGSSTLPQFESMKTFFQSVVDVIRDNGADNIIWVPGLAYQSQYSGYATYPIEGENIGYAVHVYPGWYGSDAEEPSAELGGVMGGGYEGFQRGWDAQVMPVASFAPVMVTEMDWAPAKYDSSWGKSITGVAGGTGFGANFKYIADNTGNVSWMIFTGTHLLVDFKDEPGTEGAYTFLNDPEACPWPVYHWLQEYAGEAPAEGELTGLALTGIEGDELDIRMGDSRYAVVNALYADGSSRVVTTQAEMQSSNPDVLSIEELGEMRARKTGTSQVTISYTSEQGTEQTLTLTVNVITPFPLTEEMFDPCIWETGTFDEATHTLVTGPYGFGGWQYANGLDLSGYRTLTVELGSDNDSGISFRLFDQNNYWTDPAMFDFGNSRRVVIDLHNMKTANGVAVDPSHLYIIGFWSTGGKPFVIERLTLE